jgi:hypothetical protein
MNDSDNDTTNLDLELAALEITSQVKRNVEQRITTCIENIIFILTEVNHVRLYWFWTKYALLSGIDEQWTYTQSSTTILNAFSPSTDALSYSIYLTRFVCTMYRDKGNVFQYQIASDILWSVANILSITPLNSSFIRPKIYSKGWWGNVIMGVLLAYDLVALYNQYRVLKQHPNNAHDEKKQIEINYQKQSLLTQLCHASILLMGYTIFRGFFLNHKLIRSYWGSLPCMSTTMITNNLEWYHLKNRHQKLKPQEEGRHSHETMMAYTCMASNTIFPIVLWGALSSNSPITIVVLFLFCLSILNIYTKKTMLPKRSPLLCASIFNRNNHQHKITPQQQLSCNDSVATDNDSVIATPQTNSKTQYMV